MTTNVQQWGNSLAVRIPKALAEMSDLEKGSPVELTVKNGQLIVKPVKEPALSLDELVAGITPKNRHAETDWGAPQGRELL
jgi:antitoxin MazE